MDYPIWQPGIGGGVLMGLVAVTHVIVAHFAIGGGLVIAATETLAWRRGDRELRELARRGSLMLLLVPTVFGVVTGVGIWFVAGLLSPAAISSLIHTYVWGWAMEWAFFAIEIAAALIYYATWGRVTKGIHVAIGWIYFVAAWMSLAIINGIITFMLTPGRWIETRAFWDGFLNPTYGSSLVLRTGIALVMAAAFLVFAGLRAPREARPRLMRYIGLWLLAGVALSAGGYLWWETDLPESVRLLFLGEDPALPALAATRAFLLWALGATLAVGLLILLLAPKAARTATAVVLALAAFAFFGGYERLREGARKPFLIHDYMFSNGLLVEDVGRLNGDGVLSRAPWAAYPVPAAALAEADPVSVGRAVFRAQCGHCHTLRGYQGILPLLGEDPELALVVLEVMSMEGEEYAALGPGERIDKSRLTYPFMPPFVGTEDEMYALVEYLVATSAEADGTGGERVARKGASP